MAYTYDHPSWWQRYNRINAALSLLNPFDSIETWWARHVEWPALYVEDGGSG